MSAQIKDGGAVDVLARAVERLRAPHPDHAQDAANNEAAIALHEFRAAVAELVEATKKMQRPLAELAHNAVDAEGMMSTRPITDFATGDVGPDYIAMACSALTESVAALARVGGAK